MASKPTFATVVHVTATGHVLGVVVSGSLKPTIEQLTGGAHFRVRLPGKADFVDVPTDQLTATRMAFPSAPLDLLDHPQSYVLTAGPPPSLQLGSAPKFNAPDPNGVVGKKALVVWQGPDGSFAENGPLTSTTIPSNAPPGATAKLIALEDDYLYLRTLP